MSKRALVREFFIDRLPSPIGECLVVTDGERLRALDFADYEARMHTLLTRFYGTVALSPKHDPGGACEALARYFDGDIHAIDVLAVGMAGTDFQRSVWRELRRTRPGQTMSYGELARRLGKPNAARAVGHANGSNPIGIVVPCHRVLGANGDLTGYGGGISRKRWLLEHEAAGARY